MSISSIGTTSTSSLYAASSGPSKEIREGMKALSEALKSGDLDAAKTAYDTLSQALEDEQSSGTQDARKQKLTDMLSQVGEALDSGDLSAAQDIFQQSAPPSPPPGGPQGGPPSGAGPSEAVVQDIGTLSEALNSGDLATAQAAYESLLEQLNSESESGSSDSGRDDFLSKLAEVGAALQSGDVTSAQQLFSAMTPRGQGINVTA